MAITELETEKALCKKKKLTMAKVYVDDPACWAGLVEVDKVVDLKGASAKLGKETLDAILKRSRLAPEGDEMFLEKVKDPEDQKALGPFVAEVKTHWILVDKVPADRKKDVLAAANKANSVTEWDMVEFEDMYATCANCGLSWDNKKGCVGNFGPSGSPVPGLAKKYGLPILSKVEELGGKKTVLTPKDAEKLLEEVRTLRERSPAEGKMIVRRIEGTLTRLEAMAKCSKEYGVGFYFF